MALCLKTLKLKDIGSKPSYHWLFRVNASSVFCPYWILNSLDTMDEAQALCYPLEFHIHEASIKVVSTDLLDGTAVYNDGTLGLGDRTNISAIGDWLSPSTVDFFGRFLAD